METSRNAEHDAEFGEIKAVKNLSQRDFS